MQNDALMALCKNEAIAYFKQQGLDITTKEKRVALTEEQKKQVFSVCTQLYLEKTMGFGGFGFEF